MGPEGDGPAVLEAEDVFMRFIAAIEARQLDRALELVADDVEYDNVPMGAVHGREAVRSMLGPMVDASEEVHWDVHRRAARGPVVFTERTDRFRTATGWLEIPVAGVAEVHDGRITLWRDYFDLATMTDQLAALSGGDGP